MGCERAGDAEALSDYLLALRGLLDAADEAGQPTLPRRLAALCAEDANRPFLIRRIESAVHLELALIAGVPIDAWSPPTGVQSARELVVEVEEHLRALLRDVACGYLKADLAATADDILGGVEPEPEPEPEPALSPPEGEPVVTRIVDVIQEADREPEPPRPRITDPRQTVAAGHQQPALVVDDFAWDVDDPGDYSAPV